MRFRIPWGPVAVVAAAVLMPFHTGGCGQTSCITFGQAAYEKNGGQCPSSQEALKRFGVDSCFGGGQITAVEGEGVFDGEFCCYAVVANSNNGFDVPACDVGGATGFGGEGGFATTTAVGVGGFGTTGVGGGFVDAGPGCITCATALAQGKSIPLCPGSDQLFVEVQSCGCDNTCFGACGPTLCSGLPADAECGACMQMSCGMAFTACSNDI